MQFIPWRYIADWKCTSCGECCRQYSVVIDFAEWLGIIKNYGVEHTVSDLNKFLITRRADGSCCFLHNGSSTGKCQLQHMKPKACQIWPFKVLPTPQYGYPNEAQFMYFGKSLFVYADTNCRGIKLGNPTFQFEYFTIKEFVEIAAGLRKEQMRTTATEFSPPFFRFG